jgi:hypothetical protein
MHTHLQVQTWHTYTKVATEVATDIKHSIKHNNVPTRSLQLRNKRSKLRTYVWPTTIHEMERHAYTFAGANMAHLYQGSY